MNTDNNTLRASGQLARTYAELVTSQTVLEAVNERLELGTSPPHLAAAIRPTADSGTRLLIIRVRDVDPTRARDIANELAVQITALAAEGTARPEGVVTVVDPAFAGLPVGTSTTLLVLLTVMAAGLATLTAVLLTEGLRKPVGTAKDLAEATGLDVLGDVEVASHSRHRGLILARKPGSPAASAYRLLATKLVLSLGERSVRSVAVIDPRSSARSAGVAANVAYALGEQGRDVLLVDADPSVSGVTGMLGLQEERGLAELLKCRNSLSDDTSRSFTVPHSPFQILPAGKYSNVSSMDGEAAAWVLETLLLDWEFVVVSAPPLQGYATALWWATHAHTNLLAINQMTPAADLEFALDTLRLVQADLLGAVFVTGRRWNGSPRLLRSPAYRSEHAPSANPWFSGVGHSGGTD